MDDEISLELTSRDVLSVRANANRYSERERQLEFWAEFHRPCFLPLRPESFLHSKHHVFWPALLPGKSFRI
jgi:hypothetical protein